MDEVEWARARAGDTAAFTRVYDRHLATVQRAALRWTDAADEADDLVALTFLVAWERRAAVRFVDGSMRPWLLVVLTNVGRNLSRSRRRHRAFLARLPPPHLEPDVALTELGGVAISALESLSLKDRQVVTLCTLHGYSTREAADVLGIAEGTVKSRLHRARRRITTILVDQTPGGVLHE